MITIQLTKKQVKYLIDLLQKQLTSEADQLLAKLYAQEPTSFGDAMMTEEERKRAQRIIDANE
jgi:hypothetical protein